VICRMKFQASNNLNLLQISAVYPILASVGPSMSNPNWMTLDPRAGRYRPSTSRFQKSDMVTFAVNTCILDSIEK
jgi:hypothetical protein